MQNIRQTRQKARFNKKTGNKLMEQQNPRTKEKYKKK